MSHTLRIDLAQVKRVLCLGAHSDDIEIGCGGTILRILEENPDCEIRWTLFSGTPDRQHEARQSFADYMGSARNVQLDIWDYPDRFFPTRISDIKESLFGLREQFSPDVVFSHRLEDRHQDHHCVAECTWNTFREHVILEYEIPKYEGDLGHPNLFVSLARKTCERKIQLLLRHFPSQASKDWFDEETYWGLLRLRGLEARTRYAEAFTARKLIC